MLPKSCVPPPSANSYFSPAPPVGQNLTLEGLIPPATVGKGESERGWSGSPPGIAPRATPAARSPLLRRNTVAALRSVTGFPRVRPNSVNHSKKRRTGGVDAVSCP